jgi:histidinol dehydrogenase
MSKKSEVKVWKASKLPKDWFKRRLPNPNAKEKVENETNAIIEKVVKYGDSALSELTEKFDKAIVDPKNLRVTTAERQKAYNAVNAEYVSAIKFMKKKVASFEKLALKLGEFTINTDGVSIRSIIQPIESVGCYVPGGLATYPSTLVMTTVPAKVAGVSRVVVCSPPNAEGKVNPLVLVAADICDVDEVYKVGGAQAIAALAYGTENIKPVKKIVGPGNEYVTTAKILVSRNVAIDMPAGPSEVLVVADETAEARLIALDMISQAEHGKDSVVGLITTSEDCAIRVHGWLSKTVASVERGKIVGKALEKYGFIIICEDMDKAIELANSFAPEHIEILTRDADKIAEKITSAGLVLVGSNSPVALSDYASGANHVLPTGGFASAYSGLSVLDFVRRVSIVRSTEKGLITVKNCVRTMTEAENLPNHYKALEARIEK